MHWSKQWKLQIVFELDDNSCIEIPYLLYDTPYLPIWISQWKMYRQRAKSFYFWIINKTDKDLPELYNKIKQLIDKINQQDSEKISTLEENFNQKQFNEFHKSFEERVSKVNTELTHDYRELNALIHTIESINANQNKLFFRSIIGVLGLNEALPLKSEYQLFSNHNWAWGDLTMSYATTGKNWLEIYGTNDLEAVKNNQATNKTLIRQEFVTHYETQQEEDLYSRFRQLNMFRSLYHWYNSLDQSLKEHVPIDNLNELAFRDLFIGHIDLKNIEEVNYQLYKESTNYRMQTQKNFNLKYINKIKNIKSLIFINVNKELTFKVETDV